MRKRTTERPPASAPAGPSRATGEGTSGFRTRHHASFVADFYRDAADGLAISSIGIGTYLGDCTDEDDARYVQSLRGALAHGINLVDTAINYRCQRSERTVCIALQQAIVADDVRRDEIVICSKGGYIPLDRAPPPTREAYEAYVKREFHDRGIVAPDDVIGGGHSLAPTFLKYCIARSRQNLGVRTIDVYYLHNPEQQLSQRTPAELRGVLRDAFAALEEAVERRDIGVYGVATWNGLRTPTNARGHLSLEELVGIARDVAGGDHHFRAIQLPLNLAMAEGVREATQRLGSKAVTVLEAAADLGLTVIASASLMQGRLAEGLPDAVRQLFPDAATDAQRALAFVRGVPGVASALVGTRQSRHMNELLDGVRPPLASR